MCSTFCKKKKDCTKTKVSFRICHDRLPASGKLGALKYFYYQLQTVIKVIQDAFNTTYQYQIQRMVLVL